MSFDVRRRAAIVLVALLAACTDSTAPLTRLPSGNWGGPNLMFVATPTGATLTLVCESGSIAQPLVLDATGDFSWSGIAHPNGNIATSGNHPALYSGHATRTSLTITRTITDASGYPPWTYTVTFGITQQIYPCPAAFQSRFTRA